jgi:transposase
MQRLPVIAHLSAEEVGRRYRTCPDAKEKTRWHLIWLLLRPGESFSCERAAPLVGLSDVYARAVLKRWNAHGPAGLADRRQANGRAARLTEQNIQELEELLLQGATAHDWPNNLWTCDRVAQVIQKHFGVKYHPGQVFKILKGRLNWSCQRPKHVNINHDDVEIARWVREVFPRIVQDAALRARM